MLFSALLLSLSPTVFFQEPTNEIVETWHDNGQILERYEIDDKGLLNGKYDRFYEDGILEISTTYKSNKLYGVYTKFNQDEQIILEARYIDGERSGFWREFQEGIRTLSSKYRNDILHGTWERVDLKKGYKINASYVRGELSGRYVETRPNSWKLLAKYKKGLLHGNSQIHIAGKVVSERKWLMGNLVELDGFTPFPLQRKDLIAKLDEARVVEPGEKLDPKSANRMQGLMRLKTYRALCGLPWRHVFLVSEWNKMCDAAGEISAANGMISHHPEKPETMDDDLFRRGYKASGMSNLSWVNPIEAVDSFMEDDRSNISEVGHRQWCLSPRMMGTAFGFDGKSGLWTAMWVVGSDLDFDSSGLNEKESYPVFYPPRGYVPVDLFKENYPWSIQLPAQTAYANADELEIEIFELDEHYLPIGEPLELNWKSTSHWLGLEKPCIIFRPSAIEVFPGKKYSVSVSLIDGKRSESIFNYLVEFMEGPKNK